VNLSEVVAGTIKAEGTANATGDKQRACLHRRPRRPSAPNRPVGRRDRARSPHAARPRG